MQRFDPWPWTVQFTQYSQKGTLSRPKILNALGRPIRLSKNANALIAAAGPQLYQALSDVLERADFLQRVLRSEHPLAGEPDYMQEARDVIDALRRTVGPPKYKPPA